MSGSAAPADGPTDGPPTGGAPTAGASNGGASTGGASGSPGSEPGGVRVERITRIDADLRERVLDIWTDVSNAGGWVGFVPPVGRGDVAPALDAALERVRTGRDWLVVVRSGDDLAGLAFVADNDRLLSEHWRWVLRVQVHPEYQGARLGSLLLDGIAEMARESGIEMLLLTVRGGEGLEGFYARSHFHEVARIPHAIRVAPGDDRDQVHLMREL